MKEAASTKSSEGRADRSPMKTPRFRNSKHLRLLKGDELVLHGDFIANGNNDFEPWEGPGGFRADAFLKPVYRRGRGGPALAVKR